MLDALTHRGPDSSGLDRGPGADRRDPAFARHRSCDRRSADPERGRPSRGRLQRRDLQPRGVAFRAHRAGPQVQDTKRHRGPRPSLGRPRAGAGARLGRHVRVLSSGPLPPRDVSRAGRLGHQAVVPAPARRPRRVRLGDGGAPPLSRAPAHGRSCAPRRSRRRSSTCRGTRPSSPRSGSSFRATRCILRTGGCAPRGGLRSRRPERGEGRSLDDHAEQLRGLLQDAVRLQAVADVPLGVFLSGGLDSSGITALLQAAAPGRVRSFSVGFADAGGHDERRFAALASRAFHTEHHELVVSADDVARLLPEAIAHLEEPVLDPGAAPDVAPLPVRAHRGDGRALRRGSGRAVRRLSAAPASTAPRLDARPPRACRRRPPREARGRRSRSGSARRSRRWGRAIRSATTSSGRRRSPAP